MSAGQKIRHTGKKKNKEGLQMLKSAFDYYSLKSSRCRKACGWQMEQKIRTGRKLHQNQFIARESGFYIPATNNEPLKISKASASGHSPSS